jgi:hypothetical protein
MAIAPFARDYQNRHQGRWRRGTPCDPCELISDAIVSRSILNDDSNTALFTKMPAQRGSWIAVFIRAAPVMSALNGCPKRRAERCKKPRERFWRVA